MGSRHFKRHDLLISNMGVRWPLHPLYRQAWDPYSLASRSDLLWILRNESPFRVFSLGNIYWSKSRWNKRELRLVIWRLIQSLGSSIWSSIIWRSDTTSLTTLRLARGWCSQAQGQSFSRRTKRHVCCRVKITIRGIRRSLNWKTTFLAHESIPWTVKHNRRKQKRNFS